MLFHSRVSACIISEQANRLCSRFKSAQSPVPSQPVDYLMNTNKLFVFALLVHQSAARKISLTGGFIRSQLILQHLLTTQLAICV